MEHELGLRPHVLGLVALCQGVACAVTGPIWGNLVDSGTSRKLLLKADLDAKTIRPPGGHGPLGPLYLTVGASWPRE